MFTGRLRPPGEGGDGPPGEVRIPDSRERWDGNVQRIGDPLLQSWPWQANMEQVPETQRPIDRPGDRSEWRRLFGLKLLLRHSRHGSQVVSRGGCRTKYGGLSGPVPDPGPKTKEISLAM